MTKSIDTLLTRYKLAARAEGFSEKTIDHIKLSLKLFDGFLGGVADVRKVDADDLRRFIVALRQRSKWPNMPQNKGGSLSGTTVNTYTRGVKSFWSFLLREKIITDNPLAAVPSPKIPKRLPKTLTEQELIDVFEAAKSLRDKVIIDVFLDSGMRLDELARLSKDDANSDTGVIKVLGKGNKERHVFISHKTAAKLASYVLFDRPQPVAEDRLFLSVDGYPLTASRFQKILARIGKKAGIGKRLSPHKLRHSYATLSLKYGSNLEYVRRTLGHTDIKTTQVYLSVADADVARAHQQFSPVTNLHLGKAIGRK